MKSLYFKKGFTLAEVMIVVVIIGVVAAITLPSTINKINEKQYSSARLKILNTIGEAGKILAVQDEINQAQDAKDFVENYLNKKIKIIKICDGTDVTSLEKCGLSKSIKKSDGKTLMDMPTKLKGETTNTVFDYGSVATKNAAERPSQGILLSNGYSLNLFYNSGCVSDDKSEPLYNLTQNYLCFSGIYDMNGLKGPNTVGKDIGLFGVYYPNEEVRSVVVLPAEKDSAGATGANFAGAFRKCSESNKNYKLPDKDELSLMVMFGNLLNLTEQYWSSSSAGELGAYYYHSGGHGARSYAPINYAKAVRCIKR